jgi:hypothetical protein
LEIMKVGDFLLYTLDTDTAVPPTTRVGEITSFDPGTGAVLLRQADTGEEFSCQLSDEVDAPWQGQDGQGSDCVITTHDLYTAAGTDPSPQGVALVTFADGNRFLCYVESVSPTIDVVLYQEPYHRLSLDLDAITQSDWDTYPIGEQVLSVQGYVLDSGAARSAAGSFDQGWWSLAQRRAAFAGRIGGVIAPFAVVVHTTDMVPESWDDLVRAWTTRPGAGDCAHFLIGRDSTAGVIQLASIARNANHAGGNGHGAFVAGQQSWHPNTVSVGIEVHCAGAVRQLGGEWRLVENGTIQGSAIPDGDVTQDPQRPGRGWHNVTDYQYQQLGALLDGLETVLGALPAGCLAHSLEQPPPYGVFPDGRTVGHVSLHAADRGDPWPPTCDWIRARTQDRG